MIVESEYFSVKDENISSCASHVKHDDGFTNIRNWFLVVFDSGNLDSWSPRWWSEYFSRTWGCEYRLEARSNDETKTKSNFTIFQQYLLKDKR